MPNSYHKTNPNRDAKTGQFTLANHFSERHKHTHIDPLKWAQNSNYRKKLAETRKKRNKARERGEY